MRLLFCWILMVGMASAQDVAVATNEVNSAKAVAAMSVVEEDEAAEAEEVEETVRIASEGTNAVASAKGNSASLLEKKIKKAGPKIENPEVKVDPWEAFMPPPDSKFDWIQLTSGEWLKGDFKVLYEYEIEFDSDEMDLQTFDLEDVKRLRTRNMKTVLIQGEGGPRDTQVLRGILEIKDDEIILHRTEYEVVVPRSRVISIAGGRQKERDNWSGMVSVGINARSGNTETVDTTVIANIKRRTASSRFEADYLANYSQTKDIETANNQRLSGNFDRFLTAKFFWQILGGEYYQDPFSNIDSQYSVSIGAGYDLIHTSKIEWGLGLGAGYQNQKYVSVEVGNEESSDSPFGYFGTVYDQEVTGNLDYLFDYSMRWLNDANGTYTHHMLTTLSLDLIKDLDLDVSLIWDRVEKPQAAENGTLPKKDDYQLIVSLAYDF